jgi:hypothetical protein
MRFWDNVLQFSVLQIDHYGIPGNVIVNAEKTPVCATFQNLCGILICVCADALLKNVQLINLLGTLLFANVFA